MPGKENKVQKSSQSNDVYIVEEVVKKKKDALTGKNLYLVKWIGFSSDENTWEPEESFQDDGQSIAEFEERVKGQYSQINDFVEVFLMSTHYRRAPKICQKEKAIESSRNDHWHDSGFGKVD